MREKDRKCPPSVKVRLAPLPTRNLNFGNSLNLVECLNRSVAMDRPSSRISDLSNFSANSMISVSRSNYEHQSDEIRRSMNRNVIEALRMKDLRRKRNYLNENADNYSVDLAFNSKRKRTYDDDDEESELDCLFDKRTTSRPQGTKFAKSNHRLHIPSKNRFVSSQFKNNEIASSYFSINATASNQFNRLSSSLNQPRTYHLNSNFNPVNLSLKRPSFQDNVSDTKKSVLQVPTISNAGSKENVSNSLSNASISPIGKKSAQAEASSSSSVLYKSLNSTSNNSSNAMETATVPEYISSTSLNEINSDVVAAQSTPDKNAEDDRSVMTKVQDKNHSPTYKIPEHFHSIDEHIRDEKKARSRLGNFLKAIYNVTSPFISRTIGQEQTAADANKTTAESNALTSTSTSTITFPTSTKTNDSTTFKLPSTNELKLNTTSTPLKVTFNLPASTTNDSKTTDNSSFVFKFGEQSSSNNQRQIAKPNTTTASNTSSASSSIFGASSNDQNKSKDTTTDKPQFTIPSTANSLSAALSSSSTIKPTMPNFAFGTSTKQPESSTKPDSAANKATPFAINLSNASSFNLNPTTTNSTSNMSSSLFAFGQSTATADKQQQDANKSSSFVFKFGSDANSSKLNNANNSSVAPVFNFGQTSQTAVTNNLLKPTSTVGSASSMSNSLFKFGQTSTDKQPNSTVTNKPSTSAFAFGSLDNNNSSFNTSSTFKAPSTLAFGASSNQAANQLSTKPNFSFGTSASDLNKAKDNPLLSSTIANNSLTGTNAGFNFNLNSAASKPPAFNFGSTSNTFGAQSTSTPFKAPPVPTSSNAFDASQAKPSFNFGSSSTTPASTFNFSAGPSIPQFGLNSNNNDNNSFAAFNSTAKNMFTIGRK